MEKKFYIGILLIAVGVFSLGTIMYRATIADTSMASQEVASSSLAAAADEALKQSHDFPVMAAPKKIEIPALGIDTEVLEVGITAGGNMAVPKSFTKVGWYKYGSIPGNDGNAVIAGHVDNGLSLAGVFKHLNEIKIGDMVTISDENGSISTFQVTATSSIDYQSNDTNEIFSGTGYPTLRLITCEGDWVQAHKTYDKRLIVTASRIQ